MEYKGYEWQRNSHGDSRRFNGIRIYLYNNRNGKYCFIEYGKDCDLYYSNLELMDLLIVWAVDSLNIEAETTEIRLSQDWIEGFIARGTLGVK